ncbi:helix-turn-helix domain-containing protein [Bacillus gobiensis]|uniref:PucR family transcriptional regulator n=1 Tax=Bacillus gobiensis TaxID=1441095 RepID=UPI003D1963CB
MLKRLKKTYGSSFITSIPAGSSKDYIWFQTDQKETFGLLRSAITDQEKKLLSTLFHRIFLPEQKELSSAEMNWYGYLFRDQPLRNAKHSISVQPHFLRLSHSIEEQDELKSAIKGFFEDAVILWIDNQQILILQPDPIEPLSGADRKELTDAITGDFLVNCFLYSGQLHKLDNHVKVKIQAEQMIFKWLGNLPLFNNNPSSFYHSLPLLISAAPHTVSAEALSELVVEALADKEILRTIRTYFECDLNASLAAKKLFIHRNSLQYRIDKFIEKTGIDIRHFQEAAAVQMIQSILLTSRLS